MWSRIEYGFDSENETVNFGTRTLAEGDALYETATLAVISSETQIQHNPAIKCLNQNGKLYLAIDNTFRVFSDNCSNLMLYISFDGLIVYFGVSPDGNLTVLCLNDGSVHCLHTQSNGTGKIVCSALLSESNECVISITSVQEKYDEITFIMYTNHGNYHRLNIKNVAMIYEQFLQENLEYEVEFSCELLVNYANRNLCYSAKNTRYCTNAGSFILALKNGSFIGTCKLTNMEFCLWDLEPLQDFIFLKNSNYNRLLVKTAADDDGNSFIKLLSYPDFDIIYQLKVSKNTYIVDINSEEDELTFIEGICANHSEIVNELRLKIITESIPEVKLQRILRKKRFDEAIKFAQIFGLSLKSVYSAQAEEYIINSNFSLSNPEEFCAILSKTGDVKFIVQYCLQIPADTLEGVQYLLDYANETIHEAQQNNPEEESLPTLCQQIFTALQRFDTFRILYSQNSSLNVNELIERWSQFSCCDLLNEIQDYCKNRNIDKCSLIYTQLQQESVISTKTITDILKWIPQQISLTELLPLLRNLLITALDLNPDAVPAVITWIHKFVLRSETMKTVDWPENVLQSAKTIMTFFSLKESNISLQHFRKHEVSVIKFEKLIISLSEMIDLKQYYGINVSFMEYNQDPKTVVFLLLNQIKLDNITKFANEALFQFVIEHKLNLDEILIEYIENITASLNWWEDIVLSLLAFISAETKRNNVILVILKRAEVPWSTRIKQLADSTKNEKIKNIEENIAVKLLLKKYSVTGITNFDKYDLAFIMRRILKVSKPEMYDDLNIISSRTPELKEECSLLTFNHLVHNGKTIEALTNLNHVTDNTLLRVCMSVLHNMDYYLFAKRNYNELINNYNEILNSVIQRLKPTLPNYKFEVFQVEAQRLKTVYLQKVKYNCTDLSNSNVHELLSKMVTDIINAENSCVVAANKCEQLSSLLSVSKEQCLFAFVKQCQDLDAIIYVAEKFLKADSNALDLCKMAVLIMTNIDLQQCTTETENYQTKQTKSLIVIKALRVMHTITINALVKADQFEIQTATELLNWSHATFWLRREPADNLLKWRFTPLFQPENMCLYSDRTVTTLKELFCIFLNIAEERLLPNSQCLQDSKFTDLDSVPFKLRQLQVEGYDLTTYQLLIMFRSGVKFLCSDSELSIKMKQNLDAPLISRCVQQLLQKMLVSKKLDQLLALALFLTPQFQPLNWLPVALKKYKRDSKKLSSIASLICVYMDLQNITGHIYSNMQCRCDWWNKILHYYVPYKELFQLNPEDILKKYLLSCDKFNLKIMHEFCVDFNLDIQMFFPIYLRNCLLHWNPKTEIIEQGTQKTLNILSSESELFTKCRNIISLMDNISVALAQLNTTWDEVSYYQYEIYQCILDLLFNFDDKCVNVDKTILLSFLKTHTRISKPQKKELEDWQTKFPFSRKIDEFSEYRLPFLLAMNTTDTWEIIRHEINLTTYEKWFDVSSSIGQGKDEICSYAIKGTIHSGILYSNLQTWSINSRHEALLDTLDNCVSQITNLDLATSVLYYVVCEMSGGADQVTIARMCLKKAKQWKKSVPSSETMNDVWIKVKRKYLHCLSTHILYSNNLGDDKYLCLVEQPKELIKCLYNDDRIVQQAKGVVVNCPDINYTVDELAKDLGMDIGNIRSTLIIDYLQEPCENIDCDETYNNYNILTDDHNSNNEKMIRVIYICGSSDEKLLKNLLCNITFSTNDDTITVTSSNLCCRVKALQCFLVVCNDDDFRELTDQTYEDLSESLVKLQILSTLEATGYSLTIEELDECNKTDLVCKILQSHPYDSGAVRTVAKLCKNYEIWNASLWDKILQSFVKLTMVPDLQEFLPKLYSLCYSPGISNNYVSGWQCVLTKSFTDEDFIQGFLILQTCRIIFKLDACLMNIFDLYHSTNQFELCAALLPYIRNEASMKKILQALEPFKDAELYEKIQNLAGLGILHTETAIIILKNHI